MSFVVALDLSRLALGPVRFSPRGIDRVELAYARYFLKSWPGECLPILPLPWGVRSFNRSQALDGLAALENIWLETIDSEQDQAYQRTRSFLIGGGVEPSALRRRLKPTPFEQARGFAALVAATGMFFGRSVVRSLPRKAIYLNVGQLEVFRPILSWLHRRPDICSVFLIYDLIPLEWPEHHLRIGIKLHEAIVRNTVEFAKALIVPSQAVNISVTDELRKHGRTNVPTHVELLPVPSEFLEPTTETRDLQGANYFIICGTIDSYKNHMLLLKIWPELITRLGASAPKLVIAGSAGVTSRAVINEIENAPSLRSHVILAPGLSTQSLRRLMANARALLMPSLAEGFGLPIVEALAQGTPVIASDIPPHREAGVGANMSFLPPTDGAAWISRIEQFSRMRKEEYAVSAPYKPKTWTDYFNGIEAFLADASK
jgi:glycosyltransferase involved in cell wall biosynthesis